MYYILTFLSFYVILFFNILIFLSRNSNFVSGYDVDMARLTLKHVSPAVLTAS